MEKSGAKYIEFKVLFILIWLFAGGFIALQYFVFEGDLVNTYLGFNITLFIFITFVLVIIFCFLSKHIIKKRFKRYIICYSVTFLLFCSLFTLANLARNYFSEFSRDKWNTYIDYRLNMVNDLKENYIIGLDKEEVITLLGNPDSENENTFVYFCSVKYRASIFVEIKFSDEGIVIDIIDIVNV